MKPWKGWDATMRRALSSLTTMTLCLALAMPAQAAECGGVRMPDSVTVNGTALTLNGLGIREATVFNVDVYVAGLYLEHRSTSGPAIVQSTETRRLVLHFVRDVSHEEMAEAFQQGFSRNAGGALPTLSARINRLTSWMPELHEGSVVTFTYTAGAGVQVQTGNTVRGTIEGDDFARVFFSIWLGSTPPNAGLKRGLLGGRCG
jgi:hypothetical protein